MKKAVWFQNEDNVSTAVKKLNRGEEITVENNDQQFTVKIKEEIPAGHKFAVKMINKEEKVKKYGETIGTATEEIFPGAYVHVHNVDSLRGRGDLKGEKADEVNGI